MEVKLYLAIADSAHSLDQACRFVVLLALLDDILKLGARLDAKGGLVDRLIACIELWDNKMASCTEGQHASSVRVVIGS